MVTHLWSFLGHYVIKIDNLIYNQLLAEALLTNEMQRYISICMKLKVGINGKIEIRMQISKMVYTAINSDCFAVILLGTLQQLVLCTPASAFSNWFLRWEYEFSGCHSVLNNFYGLFGRCFFLRGEESSLKMWKTECENGQIFYQECLTCQQE